jgi:hypothetical protein
MIYLERGDDIETVLDRLEWIEGRYVAVVVPGASAMLASLVSLRRLQRRAEELGLQVLLVARDGLTRALARQAGIPTYLFPFGAQAGMLWRRRGQPAPAAPWLPDDGAPEPPARPRRVKRRPIPGDRFRLRTLPDRTRLLSIFISLLVVVALAAGLFYTVITLVPVATVEVTPAVARVSETVLVTADPQAADIDLNAKVVPARLIEVRLEGSAQIATTSKKAAPNERAKGIITFANRTVQEVRVPAGAVVRTSTGTNIRFSVSKEAIVPAGLGKTADAEIVAVNPGPSGNVGAFLISTVEGSVGLLVTAVNGQATAGGDVKQVGVVTAGDRDYVKDVLLEQLRQEAFVRLQEQLDAQEFVPPQTVQVAIISEVYDKFIDELSDSLGLKMRVVATAVAIAGQDANTVALGALQSSVPPDQTLVAQGLTFERGEVRMGDKRRVNFAMTASGIAVANLDTTGLREALLNQPIERAQTIVGERLPLKKPASVQVRPAWSGRMPPLTFRINITVNTELD